MGRESLADFIVDRLGDFGQAVLGDKREYCGFDGNCQDLCRALPQERIDSTGRVSKNERINIEYC